MSAETLRRAAALMRVNAQAVDTTPAANEHISFTWAEQVSFVLGGPDASHLTTFGHPAVALAVADWLDAQAANADALDYAGSGQPGSCHHAALAVARVYLGGVA